MAASPAIPAARLPELDALRGIAALLVLLHHAFQLMPSGSPPNTADVGLSLVESTPLRVVDAGRPAVLFFFVLSGYVLTRALLVGALPPGLAAFAVQRSVRILLPAAAAVGLSALLHVLAFDATAAASAPGHHLHSWIADPTPLRLAAEAALMRNDLNVVLWSLAHEWRLTVLLPLVLALRNRPFTLLGCAGVVAMVGSALGAEENEVFLPRDPFLGLAATLYFALAVGTGCALALAGPPPRLTREQRRAAALGAVAAFSFAADLAAYMGSALLILLAAQPGRFRDALRRRAATALGRLSFSLYLVHVPVLLATWHLSHDLLPAWATVALGIALALVGAAAFRFCAEDPARRVAQRLGVLIRTRRAKERDPSPGALSPPVASGKEPRIGPDV
jgi:peptidoglycan/LPS O-acetylase OafA/YrhL